MMNKTLSLLLSTAATSFLFVSPSYGATTYAYFQNSWSTNVPAVHAGLGAFTTSDKVKVNALAPVLGKGVTIAGIDTGVQSDWVGFKGNTPGASGRIIANVDCMGSRCVSAPRNNDGNGHGTFTMSQMVGGFQSSLNGQLVTVPGVAPNANAIGIKVLGDNGSGDTAGVSRGIVYAGNNGANVMNLSLGPFDSSLIAAVNTAAAKGAYIVFAGGNDGANFNNNANMSGLTDVALDRLVFAGATDNFGNIASFSTKPGSGQFISTSGKRYDFAEKWIMAPGVGITAGSNATGMQSNGVNCGVYSCLAQSSGTSMAAPQVTGAIALLLSQWPILRTNGKADDILEYQAIWLGGGTTKTNGTTTYSTVTGQGFLDVAAAFRPIGTLTTTNLSGKSVAVSSITNANMLASSSLSTAQLTNLLKNYTSFDQFARNFSVDLSALAATRTSSSAAASTVVARKTKVTAKKFADGSSLAFGNSEVAFNPSIDRPSSSTKDKSFFMSFTDAAGSTMAAGAGFPAAASFAGAMWGTENTVSGDVASLGASSSLMNLASGGNFAAYGLGLDSDTRMAFAWSETASDVSTATSQLDANATAFGAGITHLMTQEWMAGVTMNFLNEENGMMGSTYTENSPLSFGSNHKSMSMGLTSAFALGNKLTLAVDAAIMRTNGANLTEGLISDVSDLYATSFGVGLTQRDTVRAGDSLGLTLRAPMRIVSGSAGIAMNSVDEEGNPIISSQRVNLAPSGHEMNLGLSYGAPMGGDSTISVSLNARRDADNIRGNNTADFLVSTKMHF